MRLFMDTRLRILLAGAATLLIHASAGAQGRVRAPTPEFLSSLKAGQWIQLEGTPQSDGSVLCTEVKLLTGDFLDDDWELRGPVLGVDAKTRRFMVGRYRVRLTDEVEFDDPAGKFQSFDDLRAGMLVRIEGTYTKDGAFLAKEVNDESGKLRKKPGIEKRVQIVGKIERVNLTKRSINAMGTAFLVDANTKLKSVIK